MICFFGKVWTMIWKNLNYKHMNYEYQNAVLILDKKWPHPWKIQNLCDINVSNQKPSTIKALSLWMENFRLRASCHSLLFILFPFHSIFWLWSILTNCVHYQCTQLQWEFEKIAMGQFSFNQSGYIAKNSFFYSTYILFW